MERVMDKNGEQRRLKTFVYVDWDKEKKEIEECKWQPKSNELYFFPAYNFSSRRLEVDSAYWGVIDKIDHYMFKNGLCFHTSEECQALCDEYNK